MTKADRNDKRKNRGFTLLELLLATTLFCIIAVAIYSSLAVGIKAHKRGESLSGNYNDIRFALYRINQDLRSAIAVNNIYFVSESQKIYFYSAQSAPGGAKDLYKITYSWDKEKDYFVLLRLKETYIDSLQNERQKGDVMLDYISRLSFDYGYLKKVMSGEQEFKWKSDWKQESMPKLVRLQLNVKGEAFEDVVYCPAGKMGELKGE